MSASEILLEVITFLSILVCAFWAARSSALIKKTGVLHPGQILILLICIAHSLLFLNQGPAIRSQGIFAFHMGLIFLCLALVLFFYMKAWKKITAIPQK